MSEILKEKRIVMLFPHVMIPGGALNYTLHLSEQLIKRGAILYLLTLSYDAQAIDIPKDIHAIAHQRNIVTSSSLFWIFYPVWQSWLNNKVAQCDPDIIISHVFPSNWWGWLAKRKMSEIPMLWVCHEPSAFIHSKMWINSLKPIWKSWIARTLRPFLAYVDRELSNYGDAIVANSRFTAEQVELVYGREVAGVAYPGVDMEKFHHCNHSKQHLLLTVSHLSNFKRVDFLLEVFSKATLRDRELRFAVVGDGEKIDELKALAERLNIADRVDFCGHLVGKSHTNMYSQACLYLNASADETFGMSLIEAFASGCPVISHASGGPKEIVTQETGRLLATFDKDVWVKAIFDLMSTTDSETLEACKRRASEFSWEKTSDIIELAIEEASKGPHVDKRLSRVS